MNKLFTASLALALACGSHAMAAGAKLKPVRSLCVEQSCRDGSKPWSAPVRDASGDYYLATAYGGTAQDEGAIYKMHYDGAKWVYSAVHRFCFKSGCPDGGRPRGQLVIDTSGNIYGMAGEGGANGKGVVFEIMPNGSDWTYKILHTFCYRTGCPDGERPVYSMLTYQGQASGALYDGTSPLYGVTVNGGSQGLGTVIALKQAAGQWQERVIHDFCSRTLCADGNEPNGALTVDASGNIFGTTTVGGAYNHGVVFEMTRSTKWKYTVLHSFCGDGGFCPDGDSAMSQLVLDGNGGLIGTTYFGGAHGKGSVFRIVPNGAGSTLTTLYSFCAAANCTDGANPQGGVGFDKDGDLVGTTYGGGSANVGSVFKLSGTNLTTFTSLASLGTTAVSGQYSTSPLTLDPSGVMLGTAVLGGTNDLGLIYQITP
jgi:uncharacterized repeat protein (TIGR03803 family)